MIVKRLMELLENADPKQEVIVWDAALEDHRIIAMRIPEDTADAIQLLTESAG